jgi:hypothetical protein
LFPLIAAGVIDTGGKFAAGVVDTGSKLPLVSLIPARRQICHRCQQHKPNWWQNLPPLLLTPVVHL